MSLSVSMLAYLLTSLGCYVTFSFDISVSSHLSLRCFVPFIIHISVSSAAMLIIIQKFHVHFWNRTCNNVLKDRVVISL